MPFNKHIALIDQIEDRTNGLTAGQILTGPLIVESMDSTIAVPPGWIATIAAGGYIRLRRR